MRPHRRNAETAGPGTSRVGFGRFTPRDLLRSDDGTFAVFSVFVFVAMLMVAGLAIDLMRYENERLRIQGVADRAVLAATTIRSTDGATVMPVGDDTPTPEDILLSYFAAEGLTNQLGSNYSIVDTGGSRTITVAPAATVPSLFMRLLGVDSFATVAPAQATESLGSATFLDVVMVLDVSGSMNGQQKLGAMQNAASQLTHSLLDDAAPGMVSVSLVPYDTWVLPPTGLLSYFTNISGSGACNDWTVWNSVLDTLTMPTVRRNCNTAEWRTVRPFLGDADVAEGYIDDLRASNTTSIDLGIRYGALLLDPSIRPAISNMIANGDIDAAFEGRPFDWDRPNVMRAVILLTDGDNCCGERYSTNTQDSNAVDVCEAMKENGIVVYAIAYQAPQRGVQLMQNCASSDNHYFSTTADEIADIFEGIGNNIQAQALRLTL